MSDLWGFDYDLRDMDDTLYPLSTGVNLACRKNIEGMTLKGKHDYFCFCLFVLIKI